MEEKWRKELKYTVTEGESIVTARRLSSFMQRDKNLKGGREYLIRSLYFDNLYEKVLKEKLSGRLSVINFGFVIMILIQRLSVWRRKANAMPLGINTNAA